MSKHTPGPWLNLRRLVVAPGHGAVASVWDGTIHTGEGSKITKEEGGANAHLIAAAPELLAAMQGLMEIAETAMPDTFFASDSRVNAARAAIAKAEGEPSP